jgi:cobalt-zinc-cadmium efflux system outer membrane protein
MDTRALRDDSAIVIAAVRDRTVVMPDSVDLTDGLSEAEAVRLALVNNANFQEMLTDLGLAHADVIQAGLLSNPELQYTFPATGKPFRYLIELPLDALVLRPIRARAAGAEWERVRERLTQAGLDLVRDTRLAHADWVRAREQVRIAGENRRLRERVTDLAEARLRAGDATPLEVSTARIDSLRARQEELRAANDVPIVEERLRNLVGLGATRPDLVPEVGAVGDVRTETPADLDALVAAAMQSRSDVQSADYAIRAAEERNELADLGWLRLLGIADATAGNTGHVLSPGFRIGLPIFNRNEGAVLRAAAERERAVRQARTVRERAIQEVRQAHAQHAQAAADYRQWTVEIRPAVDEAVRRAENTYREGGASLLIVLETSRQLIETRAREAQLRADLARSWAELERAVGRRVPPGSGFAVERMGEP